MPEPMTAAELAATSGNKLETLLEEHSVVASALDVFKHMQLPAQTLYVSHPAALCAVERRADMHAPCLLSFANRP